MSQQRRTAAQEQTQQRSAPRETRPTSPQSVPRGLPPILQLQRTMGNRQVAQLIQAKRLTADGKMRGVQRQLTVGAADDQYEQEADRMARQVLSTSDAVAEHSMRRTMAPEEDQDQRLQTKPLATSITPFVQRQMGKDQASEDQEKSVQAKFSTEASKEPLQRQPEIEDEETEPIQAKSAGALAGSFEAGADVETQVSQSKGHGSPLPDHVRAYMEPRFGMDFSHVRVHTGSDALQMNQAVGAQAFTHGSDIYFGAGHSPTNLALTAHELTHVVQQGAVIRPKLVVDQADHEYKLGAAGRNAVGASINSGGGAVLRREPEGEGAPPPSTDPQAAAPTAAAPTAAAQKTTPLKIRARYEDVPGASRTGAERSKASNALWFNPLTIGSLSPSADEVSRVKGVTLGGGQLIETYQAPLNENPAEGTGIITAQLQYAKDVSKSYSIKIGGLKGKQRIEAEAEAKKFVAEQITTLGDFEEIQRRASAHMTEKFPGSQTQITVSDTQKAMADASRSSFYYKARANPTILLDVPVVAVAEKTIQSGGTTVKSQGAEIEQERHGEGEREKVDTTRTKTDQERHGESSVEKVQQEYNEAAMKTIDNLVASVTDVHNTLKKQLVQKTVSEFKYHDKDDWESTRLQGKFTDYTKNVKGYTKSGEKDEKNWASWLQKGINIVKDITDLPIIADIPKVGKYLRKLKGWGIVLDVIDKGLGLFAEEGKVKYTDSKEDTTVRETGGAVDTTKGERDRDVTRNDTTTSTSNLEGSLDSTTNTEWRSRMDEVTRIKKSYSSVTTKASVGGSERISTDDSTYDRSKSSTGGSDRVKKNQSMTTTVNYNVTAKETYTKPVLQATIVDGDGEVSATAFPAAKPDGGQTSR